MTTPNDEPIIKCAICGKERHRCYEGSDLCSPCRNGLSFFNADPGILQKAIYYVCPEKRMS